MEVVVDRRGHCVDCPPCLESHHGHCPRHGRRFVDLDALLAAHTPHVSDLNEILLDQRRYNSDVDRFGQPAVDVADLALRTCTCGRLIDGFYDYIDHLKAVASG